MEQDFLSQPKQFVGTLARLFAMDGAALEVAVLAHADAQFVQTDYDNWNGGTYTYCLYLTVPTVLYAQIYQQLEDVQTKIGDKLLPLWKSYTEDWFGGVQITPALDISDDWQEKAKAWLAGKHVTNQGRVRSENLASRSSDGLLFRSQPEIHLYKALKSLGVSFAPLPVFIRGGQHYRRIEPDFVILKDGIVMVVEVDGDTVHQETPTEAHNRTTMLVHEGAHVERVSASDCETLEKARQCAQRLVELLKKLKSNR